MSNPTEKPETIEEKTDTSEAQKPPAEVELSDDALEAVAGGIAPGQHKKIP